MAVSKNQETDNPFYNLMTSQTEEDLSPKIKHALDNFMLPTINTNLSKLYSEQQQIVWNNTAHIKYTNIEVEKLISKKGHLKAQLALVIHALEKQKLVKELLEQRKERTLKDTKQLHAQYENVLYYIPLAFKDLLELKSEKYELKLKQYEDNFNETKEAYEKSAKRYKELQNVKNQEKKLYVELNILKYDKLRILDTIKTLDDIHKKMSYNLIVCFAESVLKYHKNKKIFKTIKPLNTKRYNLTITYQKKNIEVDRKQRKALLEKESGFCTEWEELPRFEEIHLPKTNLNLNFITCNKSNLSKKSYAKSDLLLKKLQQKSNEAKMKTDLLLKPLRQGKSALLGNKNENLNESIGQYKMMEKLCAQKLNTSHASNTSIHNISNFQCNNSNASITLPMSNTFQKSTSTNVGLNPNNQKMVRNNSKTMQSNVSSNFNASTLGKAFESHHTSYNNSKLNHPTLNDNKVKVLHQTVLVNPQQQLNFLNKKKKGVHFMNNSSNNVEDDEMVFKKPRLLNEPNQISSFDTSNFENANISIEEGKEMEFEEDLSPTENTSFPDQNSGLSFFNSGFTINNNAGGQGGGFLNLF